MEVLGDTTAALIVANDLTGQKIGAFVNYMVTPWPKWSATLGLRSDYFTINKRQTWSPRASLSWQADALTKISVSAGLFQQNLPMLLLAQSPENRRLQDSRAVHYVVGLERLLTETMRATVEFYPKEYDRFPIDPGQPALFVVDEFFMAMDFSRRIRPSTARARPAAAA